MFTWNSNRTNNEISVFERKESTVESEKTLGTSISYFSHNDSTLRLLKPEY